MYKRSRRLQCIVSDVPDALRHPRGLWNARWQTHSTDVALETQVNKILIATTIAMLSGTSLAFAKTPPIGNADLTTLHSSHVEALYSKERRTYKSEAAFQDCDHR